MTASGSSVKCLLLLAFVACDSPAKADKRAEEPKAEAKPDSPKAGPGEGVAEAEKPGIPSSDASSGAGSTSGGDGGSSSDGSENPGPGSPRDDRPVKKKKTKKRPADIEGDIFGPGPQVQQVAIERDLESADKKLDDVLRDLEKKGY